MAQEAIKVIVRCRPINQRERELKCESIVDIDESPGQCSILNPADRSVPAKTFTFDGAYSVNESTEQIYFDIVYPVVESVTEGYNGTVFAYGQTGCGKSFTMQGPRFPPQQRGVIPRAFEHIFEAIAATEDAKYLVHATYLEIYNEDIRDLLADDPKKKIDLKEHPDRGVYVPGLSMHAVADMAACESVMERVWKNRAVGGTLMNADSSRSHSVFTIHLEQMELRGDRTIRSGKLNLVDLAGSERQAKTGATGERLREATKINLSLSALGNVISALVDGRSKHIPYRDSKLTRLLQDSLGGNTRTLMIACVSPADNNYDETLSTLRYANRAKNIQNKPRVNEDPKDALLREYKEELDRLKKLLTTRPGLPTTRPETASPTERDSGERMQAIEKLRTEYDQQVKELQMKYKLEQESKARLQEDIEKLKSHYESQLDILNKEKVQTTGKEINNNQEAGTSPLEPALPHEPRTPHTSPCSPGSANSRETRSIAQMQAQALERLRDLQVKMVGGEKAHDTELKERRAKRKSYAERRIRALAEALAKVDDDERELLPDYDDINAELKVKSSLVKKAKRKIQTLEQEVRDLQREFQAERTDYLETIRKQDQQLRLLNQILERVQPCIRRDCNYSNIDSIKAQSTWDEDAQKWRLPELVVVRTKLPPTGVQPGGRICQNSSIPTAVTNNYFEGNSDDKFRQKLQQSEKQDFAARYFKASHRQDLLLSNKPAKMNSTSLHPDKLSRVLQSQASTNDAQQLDALGLQEVPRSRSLPPTSMGKNNSTYMNGATEPSTSPEDPGKRPLRLESLQLATVDRRPYRRRQPLAELLDWPA